MIRVECLFADNHEEHIAAAETLGMQGLLFTEAKDLEDKLEGPSLLKE